jgi:hypothetical protein
MKREEVYTLCLGQAPRFGFDPLLILAICEQESGYDEGQYRLEERFNERYVRARSLPTTTEILLSASYGLMQTMGEILREVGYFSYWFLQQGQTRRVWLAEPLSDIAMVKALNEYMMKPEWQIEQGLIWLKKKEKIAGDDVTRLLRLWNGDISGRHQYAEAVLRRYRNLRVVFQK